MTVASLRDILDQALQHGYAVGYFEAWDQYSLEAAMQAAEPAESPAILGFGAAVTNPAWLEAGGLEEAGRLGRGAGGAPAHPRLRRGRHQPSLARGRRHRRVGRAGARAGRAVQRAHG